MEKFYDPVKNLPICKFYYKGTHSHPVRRTILRIQSENPNIIVGYELREGYDVRKLKKAPIKSYSKDRISKWSQIGAANHKKPGPEKSTLKKLSLVEYLKNDE